MVNCFTLVTPTYEPMGLYLSPQAALLNHSCDHNAVVTYVWEDDDGAGPPALLVLPLRDLEAGEEITVSYIDTTHPSYARQRELRDRYFFDCKCSKCLIPSNSPTNLSDRFLSPSLPTETLSTLRATEERAVQLLQSANTVPGPAAKIQTLSQVLHILSQTRQWPIYRYPSPELRHELILAYIHSEQYELALAHAAVQCFKIDPVIIPEEWHPMRLVRAWLFVRLVETVALSDSQPHDNRKAVVDEAGQRTNLVTEYGIDLRHWLRRALRHLQTALGKAYQQDLSRIVEDRSALLRNRFRLDEETHSTKDAVHHERQLDRMERLTDHILAKEQEGFREGRGE